MLSHLQQSRGQLSVDSQAGWITAETNTEVLVEEEKNCDFQSLIAHKIVIRRREYQAFQIAGEWVSHSSYC